MFGDTPFADVPFASLGGVSIVVAACIHTDLQLLYTCSVGVALVYICSASTSVCPCESISGVC